MIKETLCLIEDIPVNNENKSLFITEIGKLKSAQSSQVDLASWKVLFYLTETQNLTVAGSLKSLKSQSISNLILLQELIIEPAVKEAQNDGSKQVKNDFIVGIIEKGGLNFLI